MHKDIQKAIDHFKRVAETEKDFREKFEEPEDAETLKALNMMDTKPFIKMHHGQLLDVE